MLIISLSSLGYCQLSTSIAAPFAGVLSIVDLAATEARTTEFGKRVQGFEEDAALTQIELARFLSALSSNRDVPSVANNTITSKFLKQCMSKIQPLYF